MMRMPPGVFALLFLSFHFLEKFLYASGVELEMPLGRQVEICRLLYLHLLKMIGIAYDAVAAQGPCRDAATIGLAVVGMFQQDSDDLHTQPFLQLLVGDVCTQVWVDLYDALAYTNVALHSTVLCHTMGAENREQGFLAEEPAFGYP